MMRMMRHRSMMEKMRDRLITQILTRSSLEELGGFLLSYCYGLAQPLLPHEALANPLVQHKGSTGPMPTMSVSPRRANWTPPKQRLLLPSTPCCALARAPRTHRARGRASDGGPHHVLKPLSRSKPQKVDLPASNHSIPQSGCSGKLHLGSKVSRHP